MEHEFAAFVFKFQAPVVLKLDNAMHWTNFYQTDSACNNTWYNTWYPLDNDLTGDVDNQLGPVSQS